MSINFFIYLCVVTIKIIFTRFVIFGPYARLKYDWPIINIVLSSFGELFVTQINAINCFESMRQFCGKRCPLKLHTICCCCCSSSATITGSFSHGKKTSNMYSFQLSWIRHTICSLMWSNQRVILQRSLVYIVLV